jgi:hypothetical protein
MRSNVSIIQALNDKELLGQFLVDPGTWRNWFTFLKAFYGLPCDSEEEITTFKQCTGRSQWPTTAAREGWCICGRRSGKSITSARLGAYTAAFEDHKLSPGEIGHVLIISQTKMQSTIIKKYLSSFFNENRYLKTLLVKETSFEIELNNRITIMVLPSDFRSVRGFTAIVAIIDELAYFQLEGSTPDYEVLRAIRPTLASTNGKLICISTPYSRQGELFKAYKDHYGKDGDDVLVWQANSHLMNPTLNVQTIERAMIDDPEGSIAEWGGLFRSDIESFISREAVESCVIVGRFELPPISNIYYWAFCDPSGGSKDSFSVAVAHREKDRIVLDAVRESRPPFSPEQVCEEFSALLKTYRISEVRGDRYAGEWPREQFRKHGINYQVSEMAKSDIYRNFLPLINSGQVELLDNKKLFNQLVSLERRTARGGKDSIDHSPHSHDDIANSAAGVAWMVQESISHAGPIYYESILKREFAASDHEYERQGGGDRVLKMKAKDQYKISRNRFSRGAY